MHPRVALPLLMVVGLVLRLPWLASRPLWLDEALQHHVSSGAGLGEVIRRSVAEDLHPPVFSMLAHGVLYVVPGEVGLRLLSLVAGVAAIGVAYGAGRAWRDPRAGLVAAALVATCPPWVAWSREGRPYALALLGILALLWAAGATRRGVRSSVPLSLAAVAAVPWHYGAWPVIAGILVGLALDPRCRRQARLAALSSGLSALPLVVVMLQQVAIRGENPHLQGWTGAGALLGLPWSLGWLATGSSSVWVLPPGVGALALGILAARSTGDRVLIAVVGLPVGVVLGAALLGTYPLGPVRHALVLAPGLLLIAAVAASPKEDGPDGPLPRVRIAAPWLMAALWAGLALGRAPGLPVEDVPALLVQLHDARAGEPVWVHPRLGFASRHYGLAEPAEYGAWGEPPPTSGWVILPADASVEDLAPRPVTTLEAAGVRAVRLP